MITQKLKTAFEKLYGMSIEKYHMIIEKKMQEKQNEQMKKVEQQIEQNLSKW